MSTEVPPTAPPETGPPVKTANKKGLKRLVIVFALLSFLGIIMLLVSPLLGIIILVLAQVIFAVAYRRFTRQQALSAEPRPST